MIRPKFTFQAERLEDRVNPASPADVFGALQRAETFRDAVGYISSNPTTFAPIPGIATVISQQSAADFAVLAGFFAELQGQIVANPGLAGVLTPLLAQVGTAEFQAQVNQVNADYLFNVLPGFASATGTGGTSTTGTTGTNLANGTTATTNLGTTSTSGLNTTAITNALNNSNGTTITGTTSGGTSTTTNQFGATGTSTTTGTGTTGTTIGTGTTGTTTTR